MVEEPVDRSSGEERVAEHAGPFLVVAVGSDDERRELVAKADELVEVAGFVCLQRREEEIVEDQHVDADELGETLLVGAVTAAFAEVREQSSGREEEHVVAAPDGAVPERLGEVRLPDAGRSDEEDVLLPFDEQTGRENR